MKMNNFTIFYEEVFENGKLSVSKLKDALENYQEEAKQAEATARNTGLTGDDLADEFFNELDEINLFSFEEGEKHIDVSLGRFHDHDEETDVSEFGVCYLVEERNLDLELQDADDFILGQEEKFIEEIKKLGYQE